MPRPWPTTVIFLLLMVRILPAVDYYVSPGGSNGNNGLSLGTAFQSITHAATKVNPGDRVLIADGTYNGAVTVSRSGNAGGYIIFQAINRWGAKVVANTGSNGFWINADYIVVDGLEVTNPGGHGINCEGSHHIRVLNCYVHHCGNSGISGAWSDFYHFEGNVCAYNAKLSWYSGISIYQATDLGDSSPGYHIIIRGNTCYGNLTAAANGPHTDGNGIIIDDWNHTQNGNPDPPYPYGALVENNLCFNNGGAGLKVCWSDGILFRNNTSYGNNTDPVNDGTYRGDLYCQQSRGCVWVNNLSWAIPGTGYLVHNTAMMDKGSPSGVITTANVWRNNLFFNGTVGQASTSTGDGSSPTLVGNLAGVHPKLVAPGLSAAADFHLLATSPAIDAGSTVHGTPALDRDGTARPSGAGVDLGCFEYLSAAGDTTPPAKPAAPSTTSTTSATPTLSGTTEAGATVRISDNGVLIATVTADGAGAWSWTPAPLLGPGSHAIRVTAVDASGNTSPSSNAVTIVVPAPVAAGGAAVDTPASEAGDDCGMGSAIALLAAVLALGLKPRRRLR